MEEKASLQANPVPEQNPALLVCRPCPARLLRGLPRQPITIMKIPAVIPVTTFLATLLTLGPPAVVAQEDTAAPALKEPPANEKSGIHRLIASIRPVGDSDVRGTVFFEMTTEGVTITARIGGLQPSTRHGIHIHEFGDLGSPDATSAGGHFNPDRHPHGTPTEQKRHAGDLGNLLADEKGNAVMELKVDNLTFDLGSHGIIGRAVIVHEKIDSGAQPSGNAGARIGAGVIGISKDAAAPPAEGETSATDRTDPAPGSNRADPDQDPNSVISPARDAVPDPDAKEQELPDPGAE